MAHRKPLGTTCHVHFANYSWETMPDLDDYLVTEAGTAYLVVGVIEGRRRTRYMLERVAAAGEGRVYEFFWLPRERRSKVGSR